MSSVCRFSDGFGDNCSRLCFIRRVLMILILSMMMMFGQIITVPVCEVVKQFLTEFYWLAFIGLTVFISVCILLSCANAARSCFPWNFIMFLFLVESLTLILAVVGAIYDSNIILLAIACEAFVLLSLIILALIVPIDFSKWTTFILVIIIIVFIYSITTLISVFSLKLPILDIIYSMIVVFIWSFTMLMNLQVLFNRAIFELYPEDFIFGAIFIYTNIIIFFMCCLKLIGFDTDE